MTAPARHLGIGIDLPFARAYALAHPPQAFMHWAAGMAQTLHRDGDRWVAGTPEGEATVEFTPENDFGVLDHTVTLPGKPPIHIPLRLIANGEGTEAVLTLYRQPDMDDAAFDRDRGMVKKDLEALKAWLEGEDRG